MDIRPHAPARLPGDDSLLMTAARRGRLLPDARPVAVPHRGRLVLAIVPALLPGLVAVSATARLLDGPGAGLVLVSVFLLSVLPGVAIYPLLRPEARGLERAAGGVALGIPIQIVAFVAADAAGVRSPFALVALLAGSGAALFALRFLLSAGGGPERSHKTARGALRPAIGLTVLLAVAAAMYLPPVLSLGQKLPDGSRAFVRNFGLDFLRHLALSEATARGPLPPAWYFADGERGDAYWLYYPGPALMLRVFGPAAEPHRVLAAWNFLLLAAFLALLAGRAGRGRNAAAFGLAAAAILFTASSLRGLATVVPGLGSLLESEERYVFTGPLFFPLFMGHHLLAIVLLLLLHALYRPGARARTLAGALASGLLLPVAVFISPFVGVVAVAWAGLLTLHAWLARPLRRRRVAASAAALLAPGALAAGAYVLLFGTRFASVVHSRLETRVDLRMQDLPLQLLLSMAPMLFLAAAGWRRAIRGRWGVSAACMALAGLVVAAALVVRVPTQAFTTHEVSTKAGMVFLVTLTFFAGSGLRGLAAPACPRWRQVVAVMLLAAGIANSAGYVRSYSNVDRARTIQAGDWEAARWIRTNLPEDARLVVAVSGAYGPKNYSFLPPLAARQAALGRKGDYLSSEPLIPRIDALYRGDPDAVAWWRETHAGWYVYCGGGERAVHPQALETLDGLPGLRAVYRKDGVAVYRIL